MSRPAAFEKKFRRRGAPVVAVLTSLVVATGCAPSATARAASARTRQQAAVVRDIRASLDDVLSRYPTIPGIAVFARATDAGFEWSGAVGKLASGRSTPLRANAAFRIASVTKTFVATSVFVLAQQGKLALDAPIDTLVNASSADILRADGYDLSKITVRQLLTHTSGIADYAARPDYLSMVAGNPGHRWTPDEQIRFVVDRTAPLSAPGAEYHYSDTGYVLLGEIVAHTTGEPLHVALPKLLKLDQLGVQSTYFETLAPAPASEVRAHQYFGIVDTSAFDPSFDLFGGGGLVSTVGDLGRFFAALMNRRILTDATTNEMRTVPPSNETVGEAAGIFRLRFGAHECWGHAGFWGVIALACDRDRLVMAATIDQAMPGSFDRNALLQRLIDLLSSLHHT